MTLIKTSYNRRSFLKVSALSGGGFVIGFSMLTGFKPLDKQVEESALREIFNLNSYIKITDKGEITILSPNPEFGQNVRTSMPMIVAEELDVEWQKVIVEQAPYNTQLYGRQFTGGSQSIRQSWKALRTAGATARQMLRQAASQAWNVPLEEITTEAGVLYHKASGKSATYGQMASAAAKIPVPKEVKLKEVKSFKLLNTPQKNVEGEKIVTGKPLFTMDYRVEGMLIAMIVHPPAFGLKLKSFDAASVNKMAGIKDVFSIKVYNDDYAREMFDTRTFNELVIIVGNSTWEVMNAKKKLVAEWEPISTSTEKVSFFGQKRDETIPAGLENTNLHYQKMKEMNEKPAEVLRKDGNPEEAFAKAAQIIERTYTCPFLAHNCMEPMTCFAHVTEDKVFLAAPIQAPEFVERTISARLGIPIEKIDIELLRMGGGFGRRAYGHYMVEAALISQKVKAPIKLIYTREDDMTYGIYRPTYIVTYRAALDANKNLIGFHVKGGGFPESAVHANRFPAGAIDNYLAESWALPTNITIGAFRAPRSNFIAGAEQAFLDELAEVVGKDPIAFRLELLKKAKENPVGKNNDYDASRYMGVLELVREKSDWDSSESKKRNRGVAAYFCHNSYAAHVVELSIKEVQVIVDKVVSAMDCGIVVNPEGAVNMVEGAVIDGIGNALYGNLTFKDGAAEQKNFDKYRIIRHKEAPKSIEVHFVKNEIDPTGLGEPPFPPVMGALANALYKATGKRFYSQPFQPELGKVGG
ncbi:xanthine dehydrogenase family protein molybdopterin-binding subunit [Thermoflexibacter ruber]|uniref:Isoquinoline 1-oxidoreductase, beta subunit n=1 Tax=Thermoflexibacter ruber TaxID=1003 RepID=A0A1I2F0X1_9BACT|nr:molybdopterin cofactor-binding domain-containing protein [Thermoflexibacter ruber]SFE98633.1 isoquinoline 1-oxidoreductase, beta subunit [Thermoflexibacter ruber]